eukprot:398467_1
MNPRYPPHSKTPRTHNHMNDPLIHQHPMKHPNNYHNSSHYQQHRQYIPCKYWLSGGCNRTNCWYKHDTTGDSLMAQVLQKMDRLMEKQNMIEKQNMDQMQHVLNRLDEYAKTTSDQTTQLKQWIENDRNELEEALLANSIALQRQRLRQIQEYQFMNYGEGTGNDLCQSKSANGLSPSRSFTFDPSASDFTSFRFDGRKDETECYQTQSEMKHTNDVLKELSFEDKGAIMATNQSHSQLKQDTCNGTERMSQSFMWNKSDNIGKTECGASKTKEVKPSSAALTFTSNTDNKEMDDADGGASRQDTVVSKEMINVSDIWNSHYFKSNHLERTVTSLNAEASPFGSNATTKDNKASSETRSEYKPSALRGSNSECKPIKPSEIDSKLSNIQNKLTEHPTTFTTSGTILKRKPIIKCVVDEHSNHGDVWENEID